jgi:hypothetical protein
MENYENWSKPELIARKEALKQRLGVFASVNGSNASEEDRPVVHWGFVLKEMVR